jgi:hypothetical protein
MYVILISSLLIILFFFLLLVSLNYILFNWESNKLVMLIKSDEKKSISTDEYDSNKYFQNVTTNTQNLINITTSKSVKVFGKLYNQAVLQMPKNNSLKVTIHKKKYSEYIQTVLGSTKKLILYIVSLTKPASIDSDKFIETDEDDTDNRDLNNLNMISGDNIQGNINEDHTRYTTKKNLNNYDDEKEVATIGLISNSGDNTMDKTGLSAFDNLENRILSKLKESGMSNYDIWLELGDLYLKYNENKKAMEVYALVLKHSKNEKHKEMARNGLIGM